MLLLPGLQTENVLFPNRKSKVMSLQEDMICLCLFHTWCFRILHSAALSSIQLLFLINVHEGISLWTRIKSFGVLCHRNWKKYQRAVSAVTGFVFTGLPLPSCFVLGCYIWTHGGLFYTSVQTGASAQVRWSSSFHAVLNGLNFRGFMNCLLMSRVVSTVSSSSG